jgi:hypothetical protein
VRGTWGALLMMSGAAVRQLAVLQSQPVSRLRYTQLGVLAGRVGMSADRNTPPGGEPSFPPASRTDVSCASRFLRDPQRKILSKSWERVTAQTEL